MLVGEPASRGANERRRRAGRAGGAERPPAPSQVRRPQAAARSARVEPRRRVPGRPSRSRPACSLAHRRARRSPALDSEACAPRRRRAAARSGGRDSATARRSDELPMTERERDPPRLPRLLREERPRGRAVVAAGAAQRPDPAVHQRRHGAVQERLHRRGDARPTPRAAIVAEVRARRRQAQRPRQRRLHRAPPHLLRDAGQLLLRRLLQGATRSSSPGSC